MQESEQEQDEAIARESRLAWIMKAYSVEPEGIDPVRKRIMLSAQPRC